MTYVDKFGAVRGKSNMSVGNPCGPENMSSGTQGPIPNPPAGSVAAAVSATIARSSNIATVTATAHGLLTGDVVLIKGADQDQYNGYKRVDSAADANTFTYLVYGSPTQPATGTITSTKRLGSVKSGDHL